MKNQNKLIKAFKAPEGSVKIYENGYLESFINEGALIDAQFLNDGKKQLLATEIQKFYVLTESIGSYKITKPARELCASKEFSLSLGAVAVVLTHVETRLAFELFLKIDKPAFPIKAFMMREEAVEWLNIMINFDANKLHIKSA